MTHRPWAAVEDSYVLRHAGRQSYGEMARDLGRDEADVRALLASCDLRKPYVRPAGLRRQDRPRSFRTLLGSLRRNLLRTRQSRC